MRLQIKIKYVTLNFLCFYFVLIRTFSYDETTDATSFKPKFYGKASHVPPEYCQMTILHKNIDSDMPKKFSGRDRDITCPTRGTFNEVLQYDVPPGNMAEHVLRNMQIMAK
jgi:hypothetical protein